MEEAIINPVVSGWLNIMKVNSKDQVGAIIDRLKLLPHPEGGYYRETYKCDRQISVSNSRERTVGTAIYYLLTESTFSEMHRLRFDEIFHFYMGDAVEMLQLHEGQSTVHLLGTDLSNGQVPQLLVPAGVWQGSRLVPGGQFALLGTTMTPGFDFADYEQGRRSELISAYPQQRSLIEYLTRV